MMRNWRPTERLDTILDRSIDRLDEDTLEAILRDYPQSGDTLAPMLQVADALRDLEHVAMRPTAKQAGRERLRQAVLARQRRRNRPTLASSLRVAAWVAVFIMLCTGAVSGLTVASTNALPNEPLYSWKRASEQVWLGLQTSTEGEIAVSLALADRRVNEMKLLYQRSGRVDRAVISQLRVDYTRTLQLIDRLPPEQAQPLLAQAQAIGAEHEHEITLLAQQATGAEHQILLAAVQVSQWVQHTLPDQVMTPPTIPGETGVPQPDQPIATPGGVERPAAAETPGQNRPTTPAAVTQPPATTPSTQPGVPPTQQPSAPQPTAAPPTRNPPPVTQPTRPVIPAPARPANPAVPTAKPEPPKAKPTNAPPTAEPTEVVQPGPPSDPPRNNPTAQPGPPSDPPGNGQPGPPSDPPGNGQPGPPSDPPGKKK